MHGKGEHQVYGPMIPLKCQSVSLPEFSLCFLVDLGRVAGLCNNLPGTQYGIGKSIAQTCHSNCGMVRSFAIHNNTRSSLHSGCALERELLDAGCSLDLVLSLMFVFSVPPFHMKILYGAVMFSTMRLVERHHL